MLNTRELGESGSGRLFRFSVKVWDCDLEIKEAKWHASAGYNSTWRSDRESYLNLWSIGAICRKV
jgi:hypothetical protein